ncbi:MAG: pilus assembly protein N-terminal domain-containing protein [Magnetospirillum sp.]|nr:pilus assembly protein N-terminal domain-containing protein [Magnetospirillum sp.]
MRSFLLNLVAVVFLVAAMPLPAAAQGEPSEPPLPLASPRAKVVPVPGAFPPAGQSVARSPARRDSRAAAPVAVRSAPPLRGPTSISVRGALADQAVGEPIRIAVNKSAEIPLPAAVADIIVGNATVADVIVRSPSLVQVVGHSAGQTNIFFVDHQGQTIRRLEVDVALDGEALRDMLRQVLPDEPGIQVAAVGESVVLSGSVRTDGASKAAHALARRQVKEDGNVVNMLRVTNQQQVLLQVKVAEMQKSVLKELGVSTSLTQARSPNFWGGPTLQSMTTTGTVGLTQASGQFGSFLVTGIDSLMSTFVVLERQGLIRTLVEPNLTAVSGETATMLAGGEYPIPVSESTTGGITIEFKPFGVGLGFTPIVLDAGRISLKLNTEVSAIDDSLVVTLSSTSVKGLKVRRAASTVEMSSGGSIMIAGLLQNDITSSLNGMPGLMDVPVLGALFKSSSFQRKESELVVIVSAYVVRPLDKPELAMPTDGLAPSSDINRIFFNRLQETYTRSRDLPPVPVQLQGPVGYIVQ